MSGKRSAEALEEDLATMMRARESVASRRDAKSVATFRQHAEHQARCSGHLREFRVLDGLIDFKNPGGDFGRTARWCHLPPQRRPARAGEQVVKSAPASLRASRARSACSASWKKRHPTRTSQHRRAHNPCKFSAQKRKPFEFLPDSTS